MQLIEQPEFGARSAMLTLTSRGSPVRFVLFPMRHLGSPGFYRAVHRQLERCDVVVVEGVGGRAASLITLAYRIAGRVCRDGLVDQGEGLDLAGLEGKIIRPDVTAAQFASAWRKVSRWSRWLFLAGAPVLGVWVAIAGPRWVLARDLGVDDLPTREEEQMSDALPGFDEAFLGDRDRALCRELERLAAGTGTATTVGVCWGSGAHESRHRSALEPARLPRHRSDLDHRVLNRRYALRCPVFPRGTECRFQPCA